MPKGVPSLGSKLAPDSTPDSTPDLIPGGPVPDAEHAEIYGYQLNDLELRDPAMVGAPTPPKCILDRLAREDRVWRWMGDIHTRRQGMRNYETVSPTAEERKLIKKEDIPGVFVNAENHIRWREDTWLAAIPRRLFLFRQRQRLLRTQGQSKLAVDPTPLGQRLAQGGSRLSEYKVDQWQGPVDDKDMNTDG